MIDIYIYSSMSLREARGGLEDDLDEFLDESGEVTGGGGGAPGWNIDLELYSDDDLPKHIEQLLAYLRVWGVPPDTYVKVSRHDNDTEQTRHDVFDAAALVSAIKINLAILKKRTTEDAAGWEATRQDLLKTLTEMV